ncbi:hypothetical protein K8O68_07060 [Salipaludibacillus sp. CUR1]|uniref:hypothetical protein n=1 Tax=Salipaludibacillus sp. CUR1 TaxID=2820003 RepID=UPI001E35B9A8|nr:hypothetical protein [Salipaludibacillus sp. CUR1]MCE7792183.1 hypothetical protein [Salipaludibacillus sp. CUR1]
MSERLRDGLISAATFAITAILVGYFLFGEIRWQNVIGLSIGGFISWYYIVPRIHKRREEKNRK